MTTYPLPTLAVTIGPTGASAPSFADILLSLQASYRGVYGDDVDLDADTQDGQWITIQAKAQNDTNNAVIAAFNSYSPAKAQGAGLSSVVKINGLQREVPSNSQANITIVGQAGTVITNGQVGDNLSLGTVWALPASVTIPLGGSIVETATCTTPGATAAGIGSLTAILTPTRGWQTANNTAAATPGNPVESDAMLRQRQAVSTNLPAQFPLDSIVSNVANLPGVIRVSGYKNDTGSPDGDGLPGHSISIVVEGGDAVQIATTIAQKKADGTGTYGSTTEVVLDPKGVPNTINFYALAIVQLDVVIDITALTGYVSTTANTIVAAVALFLSSLAIGEDSYYGRLWSPANLSGDAAIAAATALNSGVPVTQSQLDALSATYNLTLVQQCLHGGSPGTSDVVIAFNQAAACIVANITINVS